jgi:hypothetical protein
VESTYKKPVSELVFISLAKEVIDVKEKIKFLQKKESELVERLKEECSHQTTSIDGYTFEKLHSEDRGEVWRIRFLKQFDI